jgi:uncharacterized protein (DUF4415 family)
MRGLDPRFHRPRRKRDHQSAAVERQRVESSCASSSRRLADNLGAAVTLQAAEAAFKKAPTKPLEPVVRQPSIPNAKELVSLRIDRDVLEYFQESGPGWQDRINEALKKVAGK